MLKKQYTNDFLDITLHTNSKRLGVLLDHFLDFRKPRRSPSPRIQVHVDLNEGPLLTQPCQDNQDRGTGIIQGTILQIPGKRSLVEAKIDFRTAAIRSMIANYDATVKERLLQFAFTLPLQRILAKHGLFFLHAAMVRWQGQNILLCGPTGCGKSTLTLVLSRHGFDPLSDDDCFVRLSGNKAQIFPFATKAGLQEKLLRNYPALSRYAIQEFRYYGKRRVSLRAMTRHPQASGTHCRAVIFPRYSRKKKLSLTRISKHQAFGILIRNSLMNLYREKEQKVLWAFYALAQQTPCYELLYHDEKLDAIPALIQDKIAAS